MKRDEVRAIFGDGITDEQLDKLMAMNGADINAAKGGSKALEEANAGLKAELEKLRADKAASASAEDALNARIAEIEAQQAATKLGYNRMQAASKLSKLNLADEQLNGILDLVVSDDADGTNAKADAMLALIESQREESAAAAVKKAQAGVPAPKGGGEGGVTTKEQFDKLGYGEMVAFKAENPELFRQFTQSK